MFSQNIIHHPAQKSFQGHGASKVHDFFKRCRAKPAQPGWEAEHHLRSGIFLFAEKWRIFALACSLLGLTHNQWAA
jgi:hypothetical protein